MRLAPQIESLIDQSERDNVSLQVGHVLEYFPESRTATIGVWQASRGVRRFTGIPWPGEGSGVRIAIPDENTRVILGFIDGNQTFPIILGMVANPGPITEQAKSHSAARWRGRAIIHARYGVR